MVCLHLQQQLFSLMLLREMFIHCCLATLCVDMTELHQAAAVGDLDQVLQLLKKQKCDPNQKDIDWSNKTPLHWAAAKGHTETVRILSEHGARLGLRTVHGWTPAHFAAESGHMSVLRLLHSLHAPIDKIDYCGDKPVRLAEIYGHHDCVQFLKRAEQEAQAYSKIAVENGIALDESDEWQEACNETHTSIQT